MQLCWEVQVYAWQVVTVHLSVMESGASETEAAASFVVMTCGYLLLTNKFRKNKKKKRWWVASLNKSREK